MIRTYLIAAILSIVFALPTLAEAQGVVRSEDCSTRDVPICATISFDGEDNDGNEAIVSVHRFELDLSTRETLSDEFVFSFIDAANEDIDVFIPHYDVTEMMDEEPKNFQRVDGARALLGTSDLIVEDQLTLMVIVVEDDVTYIFLSVGSFHEFFNYAEEVVAEDDITIIPEGFEVPNDAKSI